MVLSEDQLPELIKAIFNKDTDRARTLLEQGADPNQKDPSGETALHYALLYDENSGEIAKLLIEKGADLEATDNTYGYTPLMYAARYNSIPALQLLIDKGVPLDTKDRDGLTALKWAGVSGFRETIGILEKAHERQRLAEETAVRDAAEAEQRRIAALHDTAAERQTVLKKRAPKIILRP